MSLALLVITDTLAALPPILPLYYLLFLTWIIVPVIGLSILAAPPDPKHMTVDHTPLKRCEQGSQLWEILDAPTASPESPPVPGDLHQHSHIDSGDVLV
jgi:hypothetical protein